MPTTCQAARALLDARHDGDELAPGERRALEEHLADCAACATEAAATQELLAAASQLATLEYPRPIVMAPMGLQPRRRLALAPWALAAASLAGAVWLGVVVGRGQAPQPSAQPSALPAAARDAVVRVVVPVAGARSVAVLGDFTGWRDSIPLAASGDGLWVGELRLAPGRYRYVILVDGERVETDPAAAQVVDDGFGGKSSVLDVGSI